MGAHEVTQEQWAAVMGSNPSYFASNPNNPVEMVSWDDCQQFITRLNKMGLGTFRLPTEAEWEYACRAGSMTEYYWGDHLIEKYAWYWDNSSYMTHSVGWKEPNAWGLYDMSGNVWEWCSDWYGDYTSQSQMDPKGPASGSFRVFRGGSWHNGPQSCRSANRSYVTPTYTRSFLGFRLVRTP